MPNVASMLKQEITRLARREARAHTGPLHKTVTRLRKVVGELKRENARARADISRLIRQMPVGVIPRVTENEPIKARYSAKSVAAQRKRLNLSAAQFGALLGVTGHTIYSWEQEKSRPRAAQLAAFAAVRGIGKREAGERLEELQTKAPTRKKVAKVKHR